MLQIGVNAAFLGGRSEGLDTYSRSVIADLSHSRHKILVYSSESLSTNGNGNVRWLRTSAALRAVEGMRGNFLRAVLWSQTVLPARLARDRAHVLLCTMPEGMVHPVCPQVIVVHDLFPLVVPNRYSRWKHYYRHILPRVLKASSRVVTDSGCTKQDLMNYLGVPEEKIEVIYPWIDPFFLTDDPGERPADHRQVPYFLFVGRPAPNKNLETVIRAFATICREVEEDLVCVLGFSGRDDRKHYSDLLDVATRLGVRDRLRIHSKLPRPQVLFLYRNATALVLLSKLEGFGYPPVEAMAVGTPAIVSDSTSLAEVAGPGAACVSNTDPGPAAEVMLRLARDPSYRAALAEKGRLHARQFSRERSGRLLLSVLEGCAGIEKAELAS
jgi:glycosyltransferase involved in cell wall biosynthesis